MRSIFLIAVLIGTFEVVIGQSLVTENYKNRLFLDASEAFRAGAYDLSQELFQEYLSQQNIESNAEAQYYRGLSMLYLEEKEGVDKLEQFVDENGTHPLVPQAHFRLGEYWLNLRNFEKAVANYEMVGQNNLTFDDGESLKFGLGYAYFMLNDFEQSTPYLESLIEYQGTYFNDASYYLANIKYQEEAFQRALDLLEGTANDDKIESRSIILMANILFQLVEYDRLYQLASNQLTKAVNDSNKELNKLCGEAYYNEKRYPKVIEHLQRYLDLSGNRANPNIFFKLGYAYYQTKKPNASIENFKKAGLAKGAIGEVSSFYLGKLYLDQNNLNYAYSAFKTVSEGTDSSNEAIKEEASFLTGKLNYQRGVYDEAILDLQSFKDNYPRSRWKTEANELMAEAYLNTSNYTQAIQHLESIVNKTTSLKKSYQKVTIQQAQLLFNDAKFGEALLLLNKSVAFPENRSLAAKGNFLKGECHTLLGQIPEARKAYNKAIGSGVAPWKMESSYGLGYLDYNDKNFEKAITHFDQFINLSNSSHEYYQDALLRLADSYYVTKQYDNALGYYDRASTKTPYIHYQQGLIYTLLSETNKAINSFNRVIESNDEAFGAKALFQLSELRMDLSEFQSAIEIHEQLLADYQGSELVPYVKSRQALCFVNIGNLPSAKDNYVFLLENHINHPVAKSALLGLQELVKQGEEVDGFDAILQRYEEAHPEDSSLEVIAYESAKTAFYDQNFKVAIDQLRGFIEKYPSSSYRLDAQYFLGDSYYRSQSWQLASESYWAVANAGKTVYQSRSLDKRGKSLLKLAAYPEAIENYQMLKDVASNAKESYLANEGLMTAYYNTQQYDSASSMIKAMMQSEWKPASATSKILLTKSKILMAQGTPDIALDELIQVVNDVQNENAAEAKYLIGEIYYQQGAYKNSLEILFDLNKSYGSYRYWVGKSFILIAQNYLQMDELLQAKATLESVLTHTEIEEIKAAAESLMNEIQAQEQQVLLQQDSTQTDSTK
ncbi:MAG: tetratricopeptide repeat protein [Cyclobacteriaceae bacterium]